MAETIILCKEGTISSYLDSLVVAANRKKAGEDIAVVFMDEGLAALVDGKFRFPAGLESYAEEIKKNAARMGVPSDPFELIKMASGAGVPLYANFAWAKLLGVEVPEGLQKMELKEFLAELGKANQVISF